MQLVKTTAQESEVVVSNSRSFKQKPDLLPIVRGEARTLFVQGIVDS